MATSVVNDIIFVQKRLGVPAIKRRDEDPQYVEAFTCDELEEYIKIHPTCSLFETLRNEDEFSIVRVFLDIDLDSRMSECDFIHALKDLITTYSRFVVKFVRDNCTCSNPDSIIKFMLSNFSITESTNTDKTSSHIVFPNVYTTMDTLIFMKRSLLYLIRTSTNPLIRSIDPAIYRKGATLRVVGTRKSKDCKYIHKKRYPHVDISNYLFTYVNMDVDSCYFELARSNDNTDTMNKVWEPNFIPFADAMRKVRKVIINNIVNFNEITEENFIAIPLIIDYTSACMLCKKKVHKHHHQLAISGDSLRIYKLGNPYSCKVKVISLEGNRLFSAAQQIFSRNVVQLTDRGEHIVWLQNAWRSNDESLLTKLILNMRDSLPEYGIDVLCPRKRKVIECNLRDMLVESIDTDYYPDKLPFNNGVLDLSNDKFCVGDEAKKFMCTVSTGYNICNDNRDKLLLQDKISELYKILDDIQPKTSENAQNRELFERVLSSCLCGITKPCLVFFYGDTATGKSTTKNLLKSVMGSLLIETGQNILTEAMDKGPNPFVGNMHLKRVVFCSELPDFACNGSKRIRSDNIKKLTDHCVVGRMCFSNKINIRNHATIVIDTNYAPVFDRVDNAIMRRIALVKFRTHFSTPAGRLAAENNSSYDKVKPLDEGLEMKIRQHYFRFAFLQVLIGWFQTYHSPILKLEPTPEAIPDFAFHRKVSSLIVSSSVSHLSYIEYLAKLGYMVLDGEIGLMLSLFQQRLQKYFNVKIYGSDIESFINRNKKFNSMGEEYLAFIFIEDLPHK
ncbi:NTPase [Sea otter poxvirus]|uniref:NTPase n=1 Tax=Sea otter poxvirus TaxID=1416741 RepID=A0A2U9QHR1_9POXV|nr:NTPase [Sea otter poxvirus]AWU47126.1 NTPase [Sea otter poxvirus]